MIRRAAVAEMGPLSGVRVVEMTGLAPAPFCSMLLANMGAEVLRIERPSPPGQQVAQQHDLLLSGRPSVTVNLKSQRGVDVARSLIRNADVLVEGFRPGVMERLGLGPSDCMVSNPRLVYGRVTGWGQNGPLANAAGHDLNYIALAGALYHMGSHASVPAPPLNLLGDFAAGGLYLAFGVVCALLEARISGRGQVVDAAMVDGAASLMTFIYGLRASGNWSDDRGANILEGAAPWYRVYETKDRRFISIAAIEDKFYESFLLHLGLDPATLPDRTVVSNWPGLHTLFSEEFRRKTRDEWCALLEGTDACFAPVLTINEAIDHPHNRARGTFVTVNGVPQPSAAPRFSRTPQAKASRELSDIERDDALRNWGLKEEDLLALRSYGVIG